MLRWGRERPKCKEKPFPSPKTRKKPQKSIKFLSVCDKKTPIFEELTLTHWNTGSPAGQRFLLAVPVFAKKLKIFRILCCNTQQYSKQVFLKLAKSQNTSEFPRQHFFYACCDIFVWYCWALLYLICLFFKHLEVGGGTVSINSFVLRTMAICVVLQQHGALPLVGQTPKSCTRNFNLHVCDV